MVITTCWVNFVEFERQLRKVSAPLGIMRCVGLVGFGYSITILSCESFVSPRFPAALIVMVFFDGPSTTMGLRTVEL